MNKYLLSILCLEILFSCACSEKADKPLETMSTKLPISWYSGYKMAKLLEQEVMLTSIDDIASLSGKKWYSEFSVLHTNEPEHVFSISSCKKYFASSYKTLETAHERDNAAFMEMTVMCLATQLITSARPSKQTYLENISFDTDLPAVLPKQLAMILSRTESDKIEKDQNIKYWSQVNKITATATLNSHLATYTFAGGEQELELVSRGDFNHDGIEDMLVTSRDSVSDGTYSAIRLVKLTRLSDEGRVVLLE